MYTAIPGAGTRTAWDAFLGGDSSACIPPDAQKDSHQTVETFNPDMIANGDAKRAISLASFGTWTGKIKPYPDGSRLGAVDGVVPLTRRRCSTGRSRSDGSSTTSIGPQRLPPRCEPSAATLRYVGEDGWICKPSTEHSEGAVQRQELPHIDPGHHPQGWFHPARPRSNRRRCGGEQLLPFVPALTPTPGDGGPRLRPARRTPRKRRNHGTHGSPDATTYRGQPRVIAASVPPRRPGVPRQSRSPPAGSLLC